MTLSVCIVKATWWRTLDSLHTKLALLALEPLEDVIRLSSVDVALLHPANANEALFGQGAIKTEAHIGKVTPTRRKHRL